MLRLWKPKIIDNSLVWLSHKEKFKKRSWQFDYTAVTNHWQFSCMAVCLKILLTTLLHSFENRWQWSYTALISLTKVLYGCHKSLTNVQNGHESQSWQNYYIIIDKITVTQSSNLWQPLHIVLDHVLLHAVCENWHWKLHFYYVKTAKRWAGVRIPDFPRLFFGLFWPFKLMQSTYNL